MRTTRLELPDGQWADLLVKPRHAEYVAIVEAYEAAVAGDITESAWALEVGRQFCKDSRLVDDDGRELKHLDWGMADPDVTDAICTEAQNRWLEWRAARRPLVERRRPPVPSSNGTQASSSGDT